MIKPHEVASNGSLPPWLLFVSVFASCLVGIVALLWVIDWLKKGKLWYFAVWVFLMCPFTLWLATLQERGTERSATNMKERGTERSATNMKEPGTERSATNMKEPGTERSAVPGLVAPAHEGRLNMSREEALKEYEKIRAEEEAKELALIEKEKKREPLVDKRETLIPLDPNDRIWLTKDGKSVVLLGRVALREGMLELFACRVGTKEHESIVSVRVKPMLVHAALLAIGAEPGHPVQTHPTFIPPNGDEIEINILWRDSDNQEGEVNEALAQDWVLDNTKSTKDEPKAMSTHWVFTGSKEYVDDDGERHYIAEETGELFGVSNFVGAILDVPIQSSTENADLLFSCFTERIPKVGTPLTLILTPVKNKR